MTMDLPSIVMSHPRKRERERERKKERKMITHGDHTW